EYGTVRPFRVTYGASLLRADPGGVAYRRRWNAARVGGLQSSGDALSQRPGRLFLRVADLPDPGRLQRPHRTPQRARDQLDHRNTRRYPYGRTQPRTLHAAAEQPHALQARRQSVHVLRRAVPLERADEGPHHPALARRWRRVDERRNRLS